MKGLSRNSVLAACWCLACVVVLKHMTLQYITPGGCSASSDVRSSTSQILAHQRPMKTQRKCAATDDAPEVEGPNVGWGPTSTGKEVLPAVAIIGTLLLYWSTVDPWSLRHSTRSAGTVPLKRSFDQLGMALDKMLPHRAQKVREQQQQFVTALALVAPIAAGVLTKTGALNVGFLGDDDPIDTLEIGKVYESRDGTGNWWPVVVESNNGDDSWACKIVGMMEFVDEPVWPQVWAGNCRKVRAKSAVRPDMVDNCWA